MFQGDLFDKTETVKKNFLDQLNRHEVVMCPCCGRNARIWKLRIHATLALMLIRLYKKSLELNGAPDQWVHIEAFKPKTRTGNDFSIVKHWGLAEPKSPEVDQDKNSSGMWRLTDAGRLWVSRQATIKKYANVFNDVLRSYDGEDITVIDALGKTFSYYELFNQ